MGGKKSSLQLKLYSPDLQGRGRSSITGIWKQAASNQNHTGRMLSIRHSWTLWAVKTVALTCPNDGNKHEWELREPFNLETLTRQHTHFWVVFGCRYVTSILCLLQPSTSLSCCFAWCVWHCVPLRLCVLITDNNAQIHHDTPAWEILSLL